MPQVKIEQLKGSNKETDKQLHTDITNAGAARIISDPENTAKGNRNATQSTPTGTASPNRTNRKAFINNKVTDTNSKDLMKRIPQYTIITHDKYASLHKILTRINIK